MIRALAWSIRRELWEHRWTYLIPLPAGAMLIALSTGVVDMRTSTATMTLQAANSHTASAVLDVLSRMFVIGGTLIAFVYCGEALHGERRDRSILFWKSVPVSDRVAVLAKACVPLVTIPILVLVLLLVAQIGMQIHIYGSGAVVAGPFASPVGAAAEVLATTLWQAPIYGWILLASSWAKRAPLLWAMLPLVLLTMIERVAGAQTTISDALSPRSPLRHWPRVIGGSSLPASYDMGGTPAPALISQPALWIGVGLAIVLIAAASRVRRRQQPI